MHLFLICNDKFRKSWDFFLLFEEWGICLGSILSWDHFFFIMLKIYDFKLILWATSSLLEKPLRPNSFIFDVNTLRVLFVIDLVPNIEREVALCVNDPAKARFCAFANFLSFVDHSLVQRNNRVLRFQLGDHIVRDNPTLDMQPGFEFSLLYDRVVQEPLSPPDSFQVLLDLLPHHNFSGVYPLLLIGELLDLGILDFVSCVVELHELDNF